MKKLFLIVVILYFGPDLFSQETETHTEERSSPWVKVSLPVKFTARKSMRKHHTTVTAKAIKPGDEPKEGTKPKAAVQIDAFDQTNSRVKRFPTKEH
jgi:hypothetical protein